jgi:hypothetical protein
MSMKKLAGSRLHGLLRSKHLQSRTAFPAASREFGLRMARWVKSRKSQLEQVISASRPMAEAPSPTLSGCNLGG